VFNVVKQMWVKNPLKMVSNAALLILLGIVLAVVPLAYLNRRPAIVVPPDYIQAVRVDGLLVDVDIVGSRLLQACPGASSVRRMVRYTDPAHKDEEHEKDTIFIRETQLVHIYPHKNRYTLHLTLYRPLIPPYDEWNFTAYIYDSCGVSSNWFNRPPKYILPVPITVIKADEASTNNLSQASGIH
jgi:hypothetical protein